MQVRINEQTTTVEHGCTLGALARIAKPGADVLILNGFPAAADTPVHEGDEVYLIARGEHPTPEELERLMAARHTPGIHHRIRQATIGIAGAGGLGSAVAVALARTGIGRLIIADYDIVEPSNLNRQHYHIDQIGLYKVDALAVNLARMNPCVQVLTHRVMLEPANLPGIFAPCSIVVEALDQPEMKAMLVNTLLESAPQTTIVAASGIAGYGDGNTINTRRVSSRLFLVGDGTSAAAPGHGLMAPRVAIAAGHQANQVLRCLLDENL